VRRESALLWFGVFGAPLAWIAQHLGGFALSVAACGDRERAPIDVNLDTWTLVIGLAATAVALASWAASALAWRATRDIDHDGPPPRGRINFLAVIGMTDAPLFLAMILMSSFGVLSLQPCVQI
jgi:hypothetical protein